MTTAASLLGFDGTAFFSPEVALLPGLFPGACWAMAGSTGQIGVEFSQKINITRVSVEHVSESSLKLLSSAPKEMEVWGSVDAEQLESKLSLHDTVVHPYVLGDPLLTGTVDSKQRYILLASFIYDITSARNSQTFPVDRKIRQLGVESASVIFRIINNWGHSDYTCIYRLKVSNN